MKDLIGAPFIGLESDTGKRNHHPISKKKCRASKQRQQTQNSTPTLPSISGETTVTGTKRVLRILESLNSLLPPSLTMMLCFKPNLKANNVGGVPDSLHYGTLNVGGCLDIGSTITGTGGRGCVDTGQQQPYMYQQQKGTTTSGNGQFENWDDNSAMADNSQQTNTYTDVDTDDKNHLHGVQHGALMVVDSTEQAKERRREL